MAITLSIPDLEDDTMHRFRYLIAAGLCTLLGGCGEPTRKVGDTPSPQPPPAVAVGDGSVLKQDLVIATNEPFLQARVDGRELVLTGVDLGERRMAVERSTVEGDTRTIIARDTGGSVEAVVRVSPCEDSMSGAAFPFSGELTVDGDGPHPGCARPASMPAPGEPDEQRDMPMLPAAFTGRWAPDAAACTDPASSEGITITADAIHFHESVGTPRAVHPEGEDVATVVFAYVGEGEQWEAQQRLRLRDADTLEITGPDGLQLQRVRCVR